MAVQDFVAGTDVLGIAFILGSAALIALNLYLLLANADFEEYGETLTERAKGPAQREEFARRKGQ